MEHMNEFHTDRIDVLYRAILTFCIIAFPAVSTVGFPYNPAPRIIDNDGDSISVQRIGDEHFSYYQTTDGNLIGKKADGVFYYYAEDGTLSNHKVKSIQNATDEETSFIQSLDKGKAKEAYAEQTSKRFSLPDASYSRPAWVPTIKTIEKKQNPTHPKMRLPASEHANGTNLRFPVILVECTNSANTDSATYYKFLNQKGYNEDGSSGSVRDYFRDNSHGLFDPQYDVYTVSVSKKSSDYTGMDYTIVKEAIEKLLEKYPSFNASQYDGDGDGNIDAVGILYSGNEEASESGSERLGGYQYELQWDDCGRIAAKGKYFNSYLLIAQRDYYNRILPIATFVHEFSHTMGLRDHYYTGDKSFDNYTFTNQYPGCHAWDVMATGMYNNNGYTPAGYSAFEKEFMGWITPKELTTTDETTVLPPLNESTIAYKVSVEGNKNEWFLLENRQKSGWDAALPHRGMLIWHIDYNRFVWDYNNLNNEENHQRIDIVEAGNVKVPEYYAGFSSNYLKDDPYPGSQNVTSFNGFQSWNNISQDIAVYNITETNRNIYFTTKSQIPVDTNAKADTTGSSGQGNVETEVVQFTCSTTIPINDSYDRFSIGLNNIFDYLGIGENAKELYENGDLEFYAVEPTWTLNDNNTANAPGMWYDAEGYVVEYEKGIVFGEVDLSQMICEVGHYPGRVSAGDTFNISQVFIYENKQVVYTIAITIVEATHLTDIAASNNISLVGNEIRIQNAISGKKKMTLCDISGRVLAEKNFEENDLIFKIGTHPQKTPLIITLSSKSGIQITKKILYNFDF